MGRFRDRAALVVGGSSGIGRATAVRLAAEGAQVGVVASADVARAESVVAEIRAAGGKGAAFAANVTDLVAIRRCVDEVVAAFGRIDVLVNSAGVFYPIPLAQVASADVDRMVDVNLKGTFYAVAAVAPHMIAGGGGKIVNVSSVAAYIGAPGLQMYSATKAAIIAMTRGLASELAPHSINVNAVAPGNTATPMNEHIRTDASFAEHRKAIAASTPSPTKFSSPEDIAGIIAFLASDESRAMHGETVLADEGLSAGR